MPKNIGLWTWELCTALQTLPDTGTYDNSCEAEDCCSTAHLLNYLWYVSDDMMDLLANNTTKERLLWLWCWRRPRSEWSFLPLRHILASVVRRVICQNEPLDANDGTRTRRTHSSRPSGYDTGFVKSRCLMMINHTTSCDATPFSCLKYSRFLLFSMLGGHVHKGDAYFAQRRLAQHLCMIVKIFLTFLFCTTLHNLALHNPCA